MARGWSRLRSRAAAMDSGELADLLGDLYRLSPENRALVEARLAAGRGGGAALEGFRRAVGEEFYPREGDGEPRLRLNVARKAIRDYERATGDARGALELMVYFVETGTRFTNDYGDIHEEFYGELEDVFREVVRRLSKRPGSKWRREFRPRLAKVVKAAEGIGWGYEDGVKDMFEELPSDGRASKGR
ncbi:MAG: hypothetical protein HY558_06330 [Euryarchaeota archaeon]|nr:hypothetical protein [Euryarchaeota archaeon]